MKIYNDIQQGSPEWHAIRARNFTASELGEWALEPIAINLTVDGIKAELDAQGIARKGVTKRDELLALLPNVEDFRELCDYAKTAIHRKIVAERFAKMLERDYDDLSEEEQIWFDRQREMQEQSERQFSYNIPVKYGNMLEPYGRSHYQSSTGFAVNEVGFIEHQSGGFGCSPDGLCALHPIKGDAIPGWNHGLEIKCPVPETHIAWLIDGKLPDCHRLQVHASMAVTGLNRWDFISYCPTEKPLLITVKRDETTERLLAGLKTLVAEKAKMKQQLARIWKGEEL
jgi:hypothetical protein